MQCDTQQPALGTEVDRKVKHGAVDNAVYDALDLSSVLLKHQNVVWADERHSGRQT